MITVIAAVTIVWYGQAFFKLAAPEAAVVIDPFDNTFFDYPLPRGLTADVLLITHEHKDHNNAAIVGGNPFVLRSEKGVGQFQKQVQGAAGAKQLQIVGTAAYHDEVKGAQRGPDTIYSFELDGIRFCHVGDLGHVLSAGQIQSIGGVDVLLIPVGGHFTLDVGKVRTVINQLKPRIVVPMHYKTKYTPKLPVAPVDDFLDKNKDLPVKKISASQFVLTKDQLPKSTEIWLLETP
jgi:L-ascorbate metabolism protein UlaG (beta-lactamase superfamily)